MVVLSLLVSYETGAQTIARDVIGSAGGDLKNPQINIAWTIGEVVIETMHNGAFYLTQGFHQPQSVVVLEKSRSLFIPEGFSPNGDGINDLFVIRGIQDYPQNSIVIFNRWGNKVFETDAYNNTWDGRAYFGLVPGKELPIGTYFYVFHAGSGLATYKGTIYLNR